LRKSSRQLGDIHRDPAGLILAEQTWHAERRPGIEGYFGVASVTVLGVNTI
jgi:hypothetical protein